MASVRRPDLTIANGQTASNAIGHKDLRFARKIMILSPSTLPETVSVQVTEEKIPAAGDWKTLQSGGVDIQLPVGKATMITDIAAKGLRLLSGVAVAGDRVFGIVYEER